MISCNAGKVFLSVRGRKFLWKKAPLGQIPYPGLRRPRAQCFTSQGGSEVLYLYCPVSGEPPVIEELTIPADHNVEVDHSQFLIPCEFCAELFDSSYVLQHQVGVHCTL